MIAGYEKTGVLPASSARSRPPDRQLPPLDRLTAPGARLVAAVPVPGSAAAPGLRACRAVPLRGPAGPSGRTPGPGPDRQPVPGRPARRRPVPGPDGRAGVCLRVRAARATRHSTCRGPRAARAGSAASAACAAASCSGWGRDTSLARIAEPSVIFIRHTQHRGHLRRSPGTTGPDPRQCGGQRRPARRPLLGDQPGRGQRAEPGTAQVRGAQRGHRQGEVGGRGRPLAAGRGACPGRDGQPPPALVPWALSSTTSMTISTGAA